MVNFSEIKGQEHAKRAVEVALSGGHSIILSGVKGMGKTMLLDAAYQLALGLYAPTTKKGVGSTGVYLQELNPTGDIPSDFRELFSLYRRVSLDMIKMLGVPVCPCGYFGDNLRECTCTATEIQDYYRRLYTLSTDFDMYIELPRVEYEKLASTRFLESSHDIKERILKAIEIQNNRYSKYDEPIKLKLNGFVPQEILLPYCELNDAGRSLLRAATNQLGLSGRMYFAALRVARTIADMNGSENISAVHIAEAVQYRLSLKAAEVKEPLAYELQGITGVLTDMHKQLGTMNGILTEMLNSKI